MARLIAHAGIRFFLLISQAVRSSVISNVEILCCFPEKKVSTWRINGTEQAVGSYARKNVFFFQTSSGKKGGGAFKENLNIFSERYRKKPPPVEVAKAKKGRNAT